MNPGKPLVVKTAKAENCVFQMKIKKGISGFPDIQKAGAGISGYR
jgi:hypothetical protein